MGGWIIKIPRGRDAACGGQGIGSHWLRSKGCMLILCYFFLPGVSESVDFLIKVSDGSRHATKLGCVGYKDD